MKEYQCETSQVKVAFYRKKRDARNRKIPFSLTLDEFKTLYRQTDCYYLGVKLQHHKITSGMKVPDNQFTIDRVNNLEGYSLNNCVVCCYKANILKSKYLEPRNRKDQEKLQKIIDKLIKKNEVVVKPSLFTRVLKNLNQIINSWQYTKT